MRNIISTITLTLAGILCIPSVASAHPDLGFRFTDGTVQTDYDCDVEDIDDETCALTCDGPSADGFECVCDEDLCECVDAVMGAFVMSPDPDEGAWCDQLRRGGGHLNEKPWCPMGQVCPIIKIPPIDQGPCSPCLYGCVDNVCN